VTGQYLADVCLECGLPIDYLADAIPRPTWRHRRLPEHAPYHVPTPVPHPLRPPSADEVTFERRERERRAQDRRDRERRIR
jgi:hypothetical protein